MIQVYQNFKDLPRRKASDKVLHEKAFDIAKTLKFDGHHCGVTSMIYKFFDKKSSNQQLAEELHKVIKNFEKRKVYCLFRAKFAVQIEQICD